MKLIRGLAVLLIFVVPLFISCAEKGKVDEAYMQKLEEIEKTQKDILAKVESIEKDQKEIAALFKQIKTAQPGKPSVDYDKVHNIPVGNSPVRGNPDAPVTIVEFSDFQCPYCSRLQPTLKQVLKEYPDKVKLVFKDFPLSFHKEAKNAAKAAFAAGEQGKYWEMHDLIFENFNKLNEAKFMEFAKTLGLDIDTFTKDYKSTKYDAGIEADMRLGQSVGVRGTPSLFMNGKRMKSRSFEYFKSEIEGYLKK
jgi:protein-disulfide isomerase